MNRCKKAVDLLQSLADVRRLAMFTSEGLAREEAGRFKLTDTGSSHVFIAAAPRAIEERKSRVGPLLESLYGRGERRFRHEED